MRIHLAGEVANLIDDFGPKVYENFDEVHPVTTPLLLVLMPYYRHVLSFLLLQHRPPVVLQVCGGARAALVRSMLRDWD